MHSHSRRNKIELMTLRRRTKVDVLIESVPKPKNAVPKRGLPLWSHLPLESKLPVLSGPKRELVFTRDKIGKKLWQNEKQNEFILYDPNCLDVSYQYDALHDENLRHFFKNKVNRKRMFDLGLITKEGDAICSLKDYNEYRRYLKRVHQDAINVERVKMEELEMERFLIWKARQNEDRDLLIHARKRVRKAKMKHLQERMAAEKESKENALIENQKKYSNRLLMIERKKQQEHERRIERAIEFEMKIKQRNKQAQEIERKRKIKAMRKWHDNDVARRKRMLKEKWEKIMEKEWKEYHTLQLKKACQEERLERQTRLLEHYNMEMALKSEIRRKHIEYLRLKMEDRIMKVKAERVRGLSEHAWSIKAMVKALCKAWEDKLKFKSPEQVKEEKCLIEKTIQLQMAEYKHKSEGKEVFAILQGAKRKLDKLFGVPEKVSVAVDCLLNNVIMVYVRKKVEFIIMDTVNQADVFKKQYDAAIREHQRKKLLEMRASLQGNSGTESSAPVEKEKVYNRRASIRPNVDVIHAPIKVPSSMKARSETRSLLHTGMVDASTSSIVKPHRLVSFGTIVTADKLKELAATLASSVPNPDNNEVKSKPPEDMLLVKKTKDRAPTPVPSVTDLVNAAFNDPMAMDALFEMELTEKKSLDRDLADFAKKLLMLVLKKADMVGTENKKKQLYRQLSNLNMDMEIVVNRIAETMMYSENTNLMDIKEVNHIADVLAKELLVKRAAHLFRSTLPDPNALPPTKNSNGPVVKKFVMNA